MTPRLRLFKILRRDPLGLRRSTGHLNHSPCGSKYRAMRQGQAECNKNNIQFRKNATIQHLRDNGNGLEQGTKRRRSMSVDTRDLDKQQGPSSSKTPSNPPMESRKAKKRRRKAEKNQQIYLERLLRLQPAQDLNPQYPPGITPIDAAKMSAFAFLPAFHPLLLKSDFPIPPGTPSALFHQPEHTHPPWIGADPSMGHPSSHTDELLEPPWNFQSHLPMAMTASPMVVDSPAFINLGCHSLPPKPVEPRAVQNPVQQIGVEPDNDPNSKHGLFKIPDKDKGSYIPTPACTLVLEQLPKSHRNRDWVNSWARRVSNAFPAKTFIDPSGAKALVEFPSAEAARAAWGSPRMGMANLGLKPHLLKGKPREDLIKAFWYRVDGVSAGVGEIEEGEIEEAGEKIDRPETKKEKKARLAKQRLEKQQREHERLGNAGQPSTTSTSNQWNTAPHVPNGLPPRPTHLPGPPPASQMPRAMNGGSTMTIKTAYGSSSKDNDDMDFSSPSPTTPSPSETFPPSPSLWHSRAAPPFVPKTIPSQPRAMKNIPTGPAALTRGLQRDQESVVPHPPSTTPPALPPPTTAEAMEATLRERVLLSRKGDGKGKAPERNGSTLIESSTPSGAFSKASANPSARYSPVPDAAESFLNATLGVSVPRPPPPLRVQSAVHMKLKAELAAKEQDIAERKELMERLSMAKTKAEKDYIFALLREKDRYIPSFPNIVFSANLSIRSPPKESGSSEVALAPMKPSAKINLNYVPEPRPQFNFPNESRAIIEISDDEHDDEDEDGDSENEDRQALTA
ncbi:hypothetical protein DFP72DRAFT_840378 [Ephemerocybe angulata]|uniref:Uncharacterized protein n=1 Tax=Ephemerocybe angulata TaxID=980116 RepID=A0A8H6IH54_9AGAR|nr:hypothetical protein DFP72DRAFT_840378 [Tulosesus angulatus]